MELPKSHGKPPGRKIIRRMPARTKWILLTIAGLLCSGSGVVILASAAVYKYHAHSSSQLLILGLYGMALLSSGVLILGQAFRFRILIDVRREARRNIRGVEKKMQDKVKETAKEIKAIKEFKQKTAKKQKGTDD
jgi:TRAP-type C4-dicarboxylate transport system permease small subunit